MQSLLLQIKQADRVKENLQRSLASSRNNSPISSPKSKKGKKKTATDTGRKEKKTNNKTSRTTGKQSKEQSEYDDTLNSILNLKQGQNKQYSELVLKALKATNNIMSIKRMCDSNPDNSDDNNATSSSKQKKTRAVKGSKGGKLLNIIDQFKTEYSSNTSGREWEKQVLHLQEKLLNELKARDERLEHIERVLVNKESEDRNNTIEKRGRDTEQGNEVDRKKKLVSGKCTKLDESDIQQ